MAPNNHSTRRPPTPNQYWSDLQQVINHLPLGPARGVALISEGVKPGQVAAVDWSQIDRRRRTLTMGSRVIYLSGITARTLGSRHYAAGPVVTNLQGGPISRDSLLREVKKACAAAGVQAWTLREMYRNGILYRNSRPRWTLKPAIMSNAAPSYRFSHASYATAAVYLSEAHDGVQLALRIRRVRPGMREKAEEWVKRAGNIPPENLSASIEGRARCYAAAAGLSSSPKGWMFRESLVQLAAMWAIDDILSEDQAEIFATLVRDDTSLDRAACLAQLLAGGNG